MAFLASVFANNVLLVLSILGQLYNTKLSNLYTMIYQSEWYRYPRSAQLYVQFIIMRSQKQFYLSAHGIMELTLTNYIGVSTNSMWRYLTEEWKVHHPNSHLFSVAENNLFGVYGFAKTKLT